MGTPGEDGMSDARELAGRVERGELRREALELLSAVGDAASRRALGMLPLVLTEPSAPRGIEELPASADGWLAWSAGLAPFERRVVVATAIAIAREVLPLLEREPPHTRAQLVGLHTGPGGAILLSEALADRILPLAALAGRVLDAAAQWLDDPSAARAAALDDEWPSLLRSRAKVALLSELAEVPWAAVWTLRWLVATVCGPAAELTSSAGCVAAYAQTATDDRSLVSRAARGALRAALISR